MNSYDNFIIKIRLSLIIISIVAYTFCLPISNMKNVKIQTNLINKDY